MNKDELYHLLVTKIDSLTAETDQKKEVLYLLESLYHYDMVQLNCDAIFWKNRESQELKKGAWVYFKSDEGGSYLITADGFYLDIYEWMTEHFCGEALLCEQRNSYN